MTSPHSADQEKTHVVESKATSRDEYSRPSSVSHNDDHDDEVHQEERDTRGNEIAQDKEAQADARSTLTAESVIPPPPDGGLHAWLKVFGGFMIYINIWYVHAPHHLISSSPRQHVNLFLYPTTPP